ncbi:MAG: helix-turn-helix domain-containing protein [Oscillospiraceae bacterium]
MEVFAENQNNIKLHNTAVALGVFDAMHIGHVSIIKKMIEYAIENSLTSCVYMFENLPRGVISGSDIKNVCTIDKRLELLKNLPICCNIDAVEDTYLIGIPSDILRKGYFDNSKFLRHLVESLSEKLYATINNSSYNFVYPLINRLSSYLVEHMTDKNYITLNSSFIEIAQFLGTTYRHLNRTLKELELKSIIKFENKKIYILDEDRLKELSKNLYIKSL